MTAQEQERRDQRMLEMHLSGVKKIHIAEQLGIHRNTVASRLLKLTQDKDTNESNN